MKIDDIEYTPNPNAMKFVLDIQLTLGSITRSFESPEAAEGVPLAREIMAIDHVKSVFFADKWLTVTQDGGADWYSLMRAIAEPIRNATFDDARPPTGTTRKEDEGEAISEEDAGFLDPRMDSIRKILAEQIVPYLQGDGGGMEIKALIGDQLMIRYQGACGTCPSSISGTLMSIQHLLQSEVDPDIFVVSV